MIMNGNYFRREIAYCGERELEEMDLYPVHANFSDILDHLLRISSDNPQIALESQWEEYSKNVNQDNYYDSVDGVEYLVQHDIVTDTCTLYEITEKK